MSRTKSPKEKTDRWIPARIDGVWIGESESKILLRIASESWRQDYRIVDLELQGVNILGRYE